MLACFWPHLNNALLKILISFIIYIFIKYKNKNNIISKFRDSYNFRNNKRKDFDLQEKLQKNIGFFMHT